MKTLLKKKLSFIIIMCATQIDLPSIEKTSRLK